ncbi:MAG: hypothetical protein PHH11_00985 [Methylomonas sp.]|nr:hypothetical protein [Methylomonas sp.]
MKKILLILVGCFFCVLTAYAELSLLSQEVLTDSEEPFTRRIYSYDFDVGEDGTIHVVYAKPVQGEERTQIIYTQKRIGENWPQESERVVLEENGLLASISTAIIYSHGTSHISYIVRRPFTDSNGITHEEGLVYQTVINNNAGEKINVSSGGFHTVMQLDASGLPIFAREYEDFLDENGSLRSLPFPKALRIQVPKGNNTWSDREYILNLPSEIDYRLATFVYDKERKRYHISYGNKDAIYLRNTYPTTNPPVGSESKPVYFPPGSGHQLRYAFSDDLINWHVSTIDGSGDISENEFWTDFIIDLQGMPFVANFRYKTDEQGVQQGSSNIIGYFENDSWNIQTVAGKTTGASPHRAGMGAKLLVDVSGYHGIWDNSPDAPIDGENPPSAGANAGTVMYYFSPDGIDWETRQIILNFSLEGRARAKIYNGKLLFMGLGDARDSKLFFAEYQMPEANNNLFEVATDKMFYGLGESIKFHARLQGEGNVDLYFAIAGPYNVDGGGGLVPIESTHYYYMGGDFAWHQVDDILTIPPVVSGFPLSEISGFFSESIANNNQIPFHNPARYRLYSVALQTGTSLASFQNLTPLYMNDIHICNKLNCAELISR